MDAECDYDLMRLIAIIIIDGRIQDGRISIPSYHTDDMAPILKAFGICYTFKLTGELIIVDNGIVPLFTHDCVHITHVPAIIHNLSEYSLTKFIDILFTLTWNNHAIYCNNKSLYNNVRSLLDRTDRKIGYSVVYVN